VFSCPYGHGHYVEGVWAAGCFYEIPMHDFKQRPSHGNIRWGLMGMARDAYERAFTTAAVLIDRAESSRADHHTAPARGLSSTFIVRTRHEAHASTYGTYVEDEPRTNLDRFSSSNDRLSGPRARPTTDLCRTIRLISFSLVPAVFLEVRRVYLYMVLY
jgi:hypothetical protein